MKLRILYWNARVVKNEEKRKVIKSLFHPQNVDLVCLQETKVEAMLIALVRSIGVGRFLECGCPKGNGSSWRVVAF
ncbi:hypothetical protein CK203_059999 [Vitis vinifera]|uniref:Endonuclease/exonuclease/phosphatase domain-containing protein n=1 Tax=Vitis vinifera TaxID=29760 RepID=A0A438GFB9_VITVI|nr:hypothetical protein CK203_066430 [Vitis vinifera]RVW70890.1 hypothetical protein CK203_059999 [Vitis vinifera]